MASIDNATQLLRRTTRGERSAADELIPLVYDELRAIADRHLRREKPGNTLQPTALAHEAYLRLIDQRNVDWEDRAHFFSIASTIIRRILVERARAKKSLRRGGGAVKITLNESIEGSFSSAEGMDLVALDEALRELAVLSERQALVVEHRFFGGLSVEETAAALGISSRTVKGDWRVARAWLFGKLADH